MIELRIQADSIFKWVVVCGWLDSFMLMPVFVLCETVKYLLMKPMPIDVMYSYYGEGYSYLTTGYTEVHCQTVACIT